MTTQAGVGSALVATSMQDGVGRTVTTTITPDAPEKTVLITVPSPTTETTTVTASASNGQTEAFITNNAWTGNNSSSEGMTALPGPRGDGLSTGAKAGIAAGVGVCILLFIGTLILCRRRRKKREMHHAQDLSESGEWNKVVWDGSQVSRPRLHQSPAKPVEIVQAPPVAPSKSASVSN